MSNDSAKSVDRTEWDWPPYVSVLQPGVTLVDQLPPLFDPGVLKLSRFFSKSGEPGTELWEGYWTPVGSDGARVLVRTLAFSEWDPEAIVLEIAIWRRLSHPNILPFIGYRRRALDLRFIFPFCKNGNLDRHLAAHPRLTYLERLGLIRGVARGLAYLHSHEPPIHHGSMIPENILIDSEGKAVLCDIGLTRLMHRVKLKKPDSITLSRSNYYDKERILNPASTTPSSDIYGLGCIMLFTMTGKEPFFKLTNPARVIVSIYQGRTPEPEDYPQLPKEDQLWNLMHKCWSAEPSARPSSSQVIYKINLIMDIGSGLTGPIVLPHVDATAETPILSPSDESIIQPGVSVPALPPPLSGDLIKIEYIGGGGYGDVHRGHWTIPGKAPVPVAIKSIRSSRANDLTIEQNQAFLLRRIRRETVIWKAAEHPNVLPFHGYQIADDIPMLVSPWFKNGNLWSYLGLHAELNDFQRLKLLRGAARGLAHLHALEPPICHGDIKPQNVIINDDLEAILCDFGISRVMTSLVGTGMTTFGTATGTHGYQAKELFEPESRTTDKSDVYAFGGLVLATMTRKPPFYSRQANPNCIVILVYRDETPDAREYPELPLTDPLWGLMRRCWDPSPQNRPSMVQVLTELEAEITSRS